MNFTVRIATPEDTEHARSISREMAGSARIRGTGIAFRAPSYIAQKMKNGNAVIAFNEQNEVIGFCYIETFESQKYVANSGLIVFPEYRGRGLAKLIKLKIFNLSRTKYPDAKIFSITTSAAVLKMNSELNYKPVIFSDLTSDDDFWSNCQTCRNFDVLSRNDRKMCLCTGMLYQPDSDSELTKKPNDKNSSYE